MTKSTSPATPEHRRLTAVPSHPGIYKKGDRYQVRYRHRGRQRARSCRTLTEAVRLKAKVDSGDTQPTSREAFNRYATKWVDAYAGRTANGVSSRTRESYRDAIERLAVPFFGTVRLDAIDAPLLREYIASLAARGLAPASVRRAFAPVRALLATAYDDGALLRNPAAGVRVVVADSRPRRKKRLTAEQTRELLAAMPTAHADLAYFMAATGCRIGEALAARWEDIGHGANGAPVVTIPVAKSSAGVRTLSLSPDLARKLTKRRAEARLSAPRDPIFPSSTGTRLDDHNYRRRVFNPARNAAGLPWATPHLLRHGLATLMVEYGYSPAQVAAQLGHADGGVLALRTYVHVDPLQATDFIDAAIGASPAGSTAGSTAKPNAAEPYGA